MPPTDQPAAAAHDRIDALRLRIREALDDAGGLVGNGSPDGYCAAAMHAEVLRELLAIIDPDDWCPPHDYVGQSTAVRGQAMFTCHICGDRYVGTWVEGSGLRPRPDTGTM